MKNTVGKNIVKLRKEQGMSQEQLAQKLHVTRQAVSNWETGRSQPDLDMLETLASAFGTDILVVIYGQMPAGADEEIRSAVRKRHLKKAVFWGILTLASYLILTALGRHLDVLKTRTYNSMPYILLQTSVMPLISVGVCTLPTFNTFPPYSTVNNLVPFNPTSQSACCLQSADWYRLS